MRRFVWRVAISGVVASAIGVTPVQAQLNTQHIKGSVGLKGAAGALPHWYVIGPFIYIYSTDTVRQEDGSKFPIDASITSVAVAAGIAKVTTAKIFGAHYGFSVLFAGINNRLQGTDIDLNPGGGISDTAVQPINLSWHFPRADLLASYTLYVPTGKYTDGATDNTGFGMWGHEPAFGTTVYLDKARQYHATTVANVTFSSKKEDSETKVGNEMNLEGGIGRDFLQGGLTAGLVYYGAFKLTEDRIDGIPSILIRGKNKVFALGPEVSFAIAAKGYLVGVVKMNFQWEVYAKTNTQGHEMTILASFPLRPIKLPGH